MQYLSKQIIYNTNQKIKKIKKKMIKCDTLKIILAREKKKKKSYLNPSGKRAY